MINSRRAFLQVLGGLSAVGVLCAPPAIDYLAIEDAIEVRSGGRLLQRVSSERPSSLALNASGTFLFAVNEISEFQGLPSGSVESFAIDAATGYLTRVSRQGLSLSATMPKGLAISPDGKHIVVAADGGSYSVLPVALNGEIGRVTQAFKEIGRHPHSVAFDPGGKFVTAKNTNLTSILEFSESRLSRHSTGQPA